MENQKSNQISIETISHIMHAYRLWAKETKTPYADAMEEMVHVFHCMGVPFPEGMIYRPEKVKLRDKIRFEIEKVRMRCSLKAGRKR